MAIDDDDAFGTGGLRTAYGRVDFLGVEATALFEHLGTAKDLLPGNDASDLLRYFLYRLQSRVDIAKGIGKPDFARFGSTDAGNVIGHDHVLVTNVLVDLQRPNHIDISFIGEYLYELTQPAFDIPEMYVEDLLALAEVAHDRR